MVIMKE